MIEQSRQVKRRIDHVLKTVEESEKKLGGNNVYPVAKWRPFDGTDKGRKKVYKKA